MSHPGRLRRHVVMRIAVAGGTGTLGRHLTAELSSRGQADESVSRRTRDGQLATGAIHDLEGGELCQPPRPVLDTHPTPLHAAEWDVRLQGEVVVHERGAAL